MHPPNAAILLVEDDDGHASLFARHFQRAGRGERLVRVSDGEEALAYLTGVATAHAAAGCQPRPGLILLDIRMPGLDGFEVLARLKRNPAYRHTPVIMLTSTDSQQEINHAYALGASAYVVKPVNPDAFADRIAKLSGFLDVLELPEVRQPENHDVRGSASRG